MDDSFHYIFLMIENDVKFSSRVRILYQVYMCFARCMKVFVPFSQPI